MKLQGDIRTEDGSVIQFVIHEDGKCFRNVEPNGPVDVATSHEELIELAKANNQDFLAETIEKTIEKD